MAVTPLHTWSSGTFERGVTRFSTPRTKRPDRYASDHLGLGVLSLRDWDRFWQRREVMIVFLRCHFDVDNGGKMFTLDTSCPLSISLNGFHYSCHSPSDLKFGSVGEVWCSWSLEIPSVLPGVSTGPWTLSSVWCFIPLLRPNRFAPGRLGYSGIFLSLKRINSVFISRLPL